MYVLVVQTGKYQGKRIKVPEGEVLIGRDETSGIRIGSDDVSRQHCRLTATPNGLLVRDLGSRNGTFVDGVPIGSTSEILLRPGGTLTVGPMTFQLLVPGSKPIAPLNGNEKSSNPLSDDEIATWLTAGDTSVQMSGADTTIIAGRESIAPPAAPIQPPPKKREFKSVAEEAADIIRRHKELLDEQQHQPGPGG
jgi:pSer/pThr/pTyr-binding forkhead associated (FHA) protein